MSEFFNTRLGEAVEFIKNGTTATQLKIKSSKAVTRIETIAEGKVNLGKVGFVGDAEDIERYRLITGDILFSHINSIKHIGKTALIRGSEEIYNGMNLLQIRPNTRETDPSFLHELLRSDNFRAEVRRSAKQAVNQASISIAQLQELEICLPPLSEQKKIAEILSGIDRVINGYMKQLKHRKLFYGSFLDKEISVSKGTRNLVPIGEVAIQSKKKGIGDLPIYSVSVEHGMIRRDSLERSLISSLDQKDNLYASEGDFCYNMMRMWQGASGIAPKDCLVSPAYVVCRPTNAVLPEYLAITCRSKELIDKFRVSSRGITSDRWRLYYEDFAKIEIPLPDKSEQSAIITRNKALLGSTYKLEEYLQKAIRLKESISSDLLSGRKRVSDARILEGVGI